MQVGTKLDRNAPALQEMTTGPDRQNDHFMDARCVEMEMNFFPVVVYRDLVPRRHIREVGGDGFESCAEYHRF